MSNSREYPAARKIVEEIRFLNVRTEDFAACHSVDDEFTVIRRKTGDLKASCRANEPGFAGRIREINQAHRYLKDLYEDGVIHSFSQLLQDPHTFSDQEERETMLKNRANDILSGEGTY